MKVAGMQSVQLAVLAALGLVAGASIIVQQALVSDLRTALNSALWAVFISYLGGLLTMVLLLAVTRQAWPTGAQLGASASLSWAGGAFGVIYIAIAVAILPRLGAATTLALVLTGQMLASVVIDHFGLFGVPRHPADLSRVAGMLLLGGGVALISR
jgi:transporter family-2 protein